MQSAVILAVPCVHNVFNLNCNGVLKLLAVARVCCGPHEAEITQLADANMGDAEKARMDIKMSLYQDAGKLKDWLSSKCSTATVEGSSLAIYWDVMDMESDDMPTSMAVCQASAEKIRTLVAYGLGAFPLL